MTSHAESSSRRAAGALCRPLAALGASVALHAAAVLAVGGLVLWRGWARSPQLDLRLAAIPVRVLQQLPLGAPPGPEPAPASPVRRDPPARAATGGGGGAPARREAGAPAAELGAGGGTTDGVRAPEASTDAPGQPSPGPLGEGPDGSRLTALIRIDRLRAGPDAAATLAAVDGLLARFPDRHRLLDGTDLDLYRDFDTLLVATPDPGDDAVTFLAARHHLAEPALKEALEKAAAAQGRPLRWQQAAQRPIAVRAPRADGAGDRDERLFLLPEPGLVVTAPSAYAALLLPEAPAAGSELDAEEPRADGTGRTALSWRELVARIDAEAGALPEDAVLRITATHLLRGSGAALAGLPVPESATVLSGLNLAPYLEVTAELADAAAAEDVAQRWPALKQQALGSPLLLLGGFGPLVSRAELRQEGRRIVLYAALTPEEMRRLLAILAGLSFGRGPGTPEREAEPPAPPPE